MTNTAVGAITVSSNDSAALRRRLRREEEVVGYIYVKGAAKRPTMNASEKLRVARDERNSPSRRREKDFMSWYCWVVGAKKCVIVFETRNGRALFAIANTTKTAVSIWIC
jgi:hypothetical protein